MTDPVDMAPKEPFKQKVYLGDGLYASYDGYHIILQSSDGIRVLDEVALEPAVYQALTEYAKAIWK